ncbi:MAG TPA: CHC2 zinc finger domain-containing protein, partial [Bradyrhizobium sp.]|nr:CHC2 zinc finger domain-containing protein [Bradyrhizobium sp.]
MPRVAADKIDADALLSSVDLGALVGKYVPTLKKDGGEFKGLCPFHNETTPSFT